MGFVTYDLAFLAVFCIFVIIFLSTRKKNLHRQGLIFLYKTQLGVKFMDVFARRFEKILKPARYVVVACGYGLLVVGAWMIIKTAYLYVRYPISDYIKAPPVAPLIPYFPELFGLESFLPPLYFTYFIVVLSFVAVFHEMFHGIFARLEKFKIHSTGFAFFGPILGAFVEPDEKEMAKAKKFPQLSVLAAGTFANVLMTIIFGVIIFLFFTSVFVPAGVKFTGYGMSAINVSQIDSIVASDAHEGFSELMVGENKYYFTTSLLGTVRDEGIEQIAVFDSAPAFEAGLVGAITEFDGVPIRDYETLTSEIQRHSPGDKVVVKTAVLANGRDSEPTIESFDVTLGEREGRTILGISSQNRESGGFLGWFDKNFVQKMKAPLVYYESKWGDFGWFVYYLLWWMVVINIAVALFNMLPLGILDGGKFFYLTIWGLTGKESYAKKSYKIATWFLIALFAVMMVKWFFGVF